MDFKRKKKARAVCKTGPADLEPATHINIVSPTGRNSGAGPRAVNVSTLGLSNDNDGL